MRLSASFEMPAVRFWIPRVMSKPQATIARTHRGVYTDTMASTPTRSRARRNVSLDHDAEALLARVGNASEYLSRTITRRWKQWTGAVELLRSAGWTPAQIFVACEILNGYWLVGNTAHGAYLAGILRSEVTGAPKTWKQRVDAIAKDAGQATALAIVVDEYWSGNADCKAAVRA